MVARITIPDSLKETLNYNEKKVQKGVATCIGAGNFLLEVQHMNFYQKLHRFENRNLLNDRAATKTIHISLNFDPSENHSTEQLKIIADEYMQRIGFGEQPYLIYQHQDAAHPHIHILSTTIREDGTRINTHNICRNQSEMARKAIEEKYNLIRATRDQNTTQHKLTAFDLTRLEYGKTETRRGIANILSQVLKSYNYTSLPELNAILKQFSITADRGEETSFTYRKHGLLYKVLDSGGNKIGVPIKASSLPGKPTLSFLETRFAFNKTKREIPKLALQKAIDETLGHHPANLEQFITALCQKQITAVIRQNAEGRIYGITFVDHKNKSVFNGSEIGKQYSIAGLNKQFQQSLTIQHQQTTQKDLLHGISNHLIEQLFIPIEDHTLTPFHLRKKKRKKKD